MNLRDELIEKWKHVIRLSDHIFTWTGDGELAFCAEVAFKAGFNAVGVEVGTYMGRSARVMLDANPALNLICVDTFEVAGTENCSRYFLRQYIKEGRCRILKCDSARAAAEAKILKADFVFIDDGHTEQDVLRDINSLWPILASGGLMFGHDFEEPHNGVARGVIESGLKFEVPIPMIWAAVKP